MEHVKEGSNKAADGEDTPPTTGVCEVVGDLERPVYLIKNESQGNKGPHSHSSLPPNVCPSSIMQQQGGTVWVKSSGRVTLTENLVYFLLSKTSEAPFLSNAIMRQ